MTALRDYRHIWTVTTTRHERGAMDILRWVVLGLALVGAVIALLHHKGGPVAALRVLLSFGIVWLAILWMFLFMPASLLLNSAANAKLLPRQRRRLMEMAAAGWVFVTLATVVVVGSWKYSPLVALYFLALALTLAGRHSALAIILVLTNWNWLWSKALPAPVVQAVESGAGRVALMFVALAAGAWSLRWLYPAGGDAHFERLAGQVQHLSRFTRPGRFLRQDMAPKTVPLGWHLYPAALRRVCRRGDPGALLLQVLGPSAQWTAWLSGAGIIVAFGMAVRLWRGPIGGFAANLATAAVTIGPLLLLMSSTGHYGQLLRKTCGEQSLLRLTPRVGDTALLNRRLATQLLRQALCTLAMLTAAIVLTAALLGAGQDAILRELALCCLAAQAAMTGLLGDYASGERSNLRRWLEAILPAVLEAAVACGFGRALGTSPWPWLALLAVGIGTGQAWLGWVHMLAAPPAFPVGRP